jgi:hypothetical protein
VSLERGPISLVSLVSLMRSIEELLEQKSSGSTSRHQTLTAVGTSYADHVTPLYLQKLARTSPTGGGRSVGIVRSRTKAMEFIYIYMELLVRPEILTSYIHGLTYGKAESRLFLFAAQCFNSE